MLTNAQRWSTNKFYVVTLYLQKICVMIVDKLTPIQLELLKVYSFQPSDEDLLAVKKLFLGQAGQ